MPARNTMRSTIMRPRVWFPWQDPFCPRIEVALSYFAQAQVYRSLVGTPIYEIVHRFTQLIYQCHKKTVTNQESCHPFERLFDTSRESHSQPATRDDHKRKWPAIALDGL